jgi:hypothetical protein
MGHIRAFVEVRIYFFCLVCPSSLLSLSPFQPFIRKRGISFSYFFTPFSTFSLLFSLFPFEKVMKKEEKVHQKCPFSPYSK